MNLPPKLHALAYRTAYRIPVKWRRRLVRMVVPRYTIGSVILVRDADAPEPGRIVLLRQPPGHGWSLPAGLLDRHESPLDAAVRELFEETGIKVAAADVTPTTPNAVVHVDGQWVDCVFEVRVPGDVELRVDGGEVLEAAWFRLDALPPLRSSAARLLAVYGIGPYVGYPEAQV
jgi:ADP-ribose pyrophosphatase YjhB (NUDIX family)